MADLWLCEEFDQELDRLYAERPDVVVVVDLLIELLHEDSDLLEHLCRPASYFHTAPPFEAKRYAEMQRMGLNIYTIKFRLDDGSWAPYRVLIGFNAQANSYHALAIVDRGIAYERSDPTFAEVIQRYERAGIPNYS